MIMKILKKIQTIIKDIMSANCRHSFCRGGDSLTGERISKIINCSEAELKTIRDRKLGKKE